MVRAGASVDAVGRPSDICELISMTAGTVAFVETCSSLQFKCLIQLVLQPVYHREEPPSTAPSCRQNTHRLKETLVC